MGDDDSVITHRQEELNKNSTFICYSRLVSGQGVTQHLSFFRSPLYCLDQLVSITAVLVACGDFQRCIFMCRCLE